MARERLTSKTAEDLLINDTAAMNNPDHAKNDPKIDEYAKGSPSEWAEDVDGSDLWKKDKRNESNVPEMTTKQAAEAVAAAKKLEAKAIKCIVASQRMLPGASDEWIEAQAADLLHLPDICVNATLARQEGLAKLIAKAASESAEESEEGDKDDKDDEDTSEAPAGDDEDTSEAPAGDDDKTAGKAAPAEGGTEDDDLEKMASAIISGDISKLPPALQAHIKKKQEEKKDVDAVKAVKKEEDENADEVVNAGKSKKEDDEGMTDEGMNRDASEEVSLLDEIFSSVTASDSKKGANTLKGLVRKEASEGSNGMDSLWDAPPDVSKVFR
jgi:hypothetical protein